MLQWEDRLAAAETHEEILFVASDFLASLDYLEIERLPRACRPRPLTGAADLNSYMSDLVSCAAGRNRDSDGAAEVMMRMLMFFSRTADRLALLDRTNDPHGSVKRTA